MHYRDSKTGKTFDRKLRRCSDEPGRAYELTFSCYHRHRFLEKDRTRHWFIDALAEARSVLKFDLWTYVIMPEHVHLLVYPGESGRRPERFEGGSKRTWLVRPLLILPRTPPNGWRRLPCARGLASDAGSGNPEVAAIEMPSRSRPLTR